MSPQWTGVGTALVTPFTAAGAVDEAAVQRLARRQIDAGVHFLSPCGTTGEAPTLSDDEKVRVVELVVEEAEGRIPILAGAGGYSTREVIGLVDRMERAGADGILSVTPYYNKPTPAGLFEHYKAISESTALPIIVYNVPGRTGVNVDVLTLVRIAELKNIVAVKEASGNLEQIAEICATLPESFIVLAGDDELVMRVLALGGHGVISVVANEVPADMVQIVNKVQENDLEFAQKLYDRLLPLMQVNFLESNPVPVKAAMAAMGLMNEVYRLPMTSPQTKTRDSIIRILRDLKLNTETANT
jgi:4-hydroxy-tetrahydrodipicolinate synthase